MTSMKKLLCLGIESTAHAFSMGIVSSDGEILSMASREFLPEKGGIHPREAAKFISSIASEVLLETIERSEKKLSSMDFIAFSQGPGLGPCLRTGATVARALAAYLDVPLVGVNHCVAHIEIGKLLTGVKDPVTLYVSGGNTIVASYEGGRYRIFGETLDIAVGNCLDVFAREAGIPHPGGPRIEKLAEEGKNFIPLPYTVKGMDLSFSGLLTAAISALRKGYRLEDICYSLQETAFSMLAEVTERAVAHTEKKEVLLTGGVAANRRLQAMIESIAEEHGARFCVVPKEYAGDNGSMIAWTGVLAFKHGMTSPIEKSFIKQKWRLDDVEAPWVE